jgi:acyl carrier protein
MDEQQLRAQMLETFRDVFGDPSLVVQDSITAEDVEGWDSLTHIDLIVALERKFRVKFTTGEVGKLTNVGDLVTLIKSKTS